MNKGEKFNKKQNLKVQKLIILGRRPKSMTGMWALIFHWAVP